MNTRITPKIVLAIEECEQIRGLQFFQCSYDSNAFDQVESWTHLESLEIGTHVQAEFCHYSFLASLHNVSDLAIDFASLDLGDVTRHVHKSKLTHLTLVGVKLTRGLDRVDELPNLVYLDVRKSSIEDGDLRQLAHVAGLASLNLEGTGITDVGLQHLIEMPIRNLEYICLRGTHVSALMVEKIRSAYPECRIAE